MRRQDAKVAKVAKVAKKIGNPSEALAFLAP